MALSKAVISGSYRDAMDAAGLTSAKAVFILSGFDTEGSAAVVPTEVVAALENGALPAGFGLWKNTTGLRGTFYRHVLRGEREDRPGFWSQVEIPMPSIQVGPMASYTLVALLNNPVPDHPGWNVNLDPDAWNALQAQFEAAAAARAAADEARDAVLAVMTPVSQFGLMGDGSYEDAALVAALTSGVAGIEFDGTRTYRFNAQHRLRGVQDLTIKMNGATLLRGPDGRGGVQWIGAKRVRTLWGGGKLVGNRDTAGPWPSLFTTTGITNGDGVGSAAASYTAGYAGPISIENLGTGYVKKGDSFTYVRLGVTYRHIVKADVPIAGGIAVGLILDRPLEAQITAGQQIFINMWSRRMVVSEDAAMGATVLTLECADVTSLDGNPRLIEGDVFCPYLNYNDVTQPDYSMVCEVLLGGPVVGAYPARKVTVTLKQPLPRALKAGDMMTSIMDGRNQDEMLWGFYGCDDCWVDDVEVSNARVHGIGSAVIRAPWDGVDPSTMVNKRMRYTNIRDRSSDGVGATPVLAWHEDFLVAYPRSTLTLGSARSGVIVERSQRGRIVSPEIYGGQYGVRINGECSLITITDLMANSTMRAFLQGNTSNHIRLYGGTVLTHASWSDYAAMILATALDEDDVLVVGASVRNHTLIDGLTCIGPTRTTGLMVGAGSHIIVAPQGDTAPEAVVLRDVVSSGASKHGAYVEAGVDCTLSGVRIEKSGQAGVKGVGGSGNTLDGVSVDEAGLSWAGGAAPKFAGVELDGGTDWALRKMRTRPRGSAGMGRGLALTGGATVAQWSEMDLEGADLSGGGPAITFVARADAVAACGCGWRAAAGEIVIVGGVPMIGVTGSTTIADLPGLEYHVFGATEAAAMRAAIGLVPGTHVQGWDADLAAIATLTGAADRVPMFTGPGAASLIAVTAAARTVLDDPDVATMRATLGVVPTAAVDDTTAGRLMKVGDFGVGAVAAAPEVTLATAVKSGMWSFAAADASAPVAGQSGSVQVVRGNAATTVRQIAQTGTPAREYKRVSSDNGVTWSAWDREMAQSNLLGTVSQSGGVPSGDAWERGANGNGLWHRDAAYQMRVARDNFLVGSITTADGGSFRSGDVTWTFPQPFAAPPVPGLVALDPQCEVHVVSVTKTAVTFRVISTVAKNFATVCCEAIGRWWTTGVASPADLFSAGQKGVWYDFADPATLFTDTARTTLITASGASVAGIADKSGNAVHLAQATPTKLGAAWIGSDGRGGVDCDGLDDCYASVANLDLAASQVTIFAAYRKTSDALGFICELGASAYSIPNTFALITSPGGAQSAQMYSRGATGAGGGTITGLVAPLTCVAVGRGDTAAPLAGLRVNKGAEAFQTIAQGGGNYAAAILNVGARGGGGGFQGRLVELIIRAGTVSEADIASLTEYLYAKAGA